MPATAPSPVVEENGNSESNGANCASAKIQAADDRAKFMAVYDRLKGLVLADSDTFKYTPESRAWVEEMLDYNVPGGKLNRGLSVIDSLRLLKGEELSGQEVFLACALGWCIEWLQAYFLVLDDIMDSSVTRRGQPCWYRVPKVGSIAINDGILLRNHIYVIIKTHFRDQPFYVELVDLFNEVEYQTSTGQMLDLITTPAGEVDLSKYVLPTYLRIVQFKTAYYSFYLPVACALLLAGEKLEKHGTVKDILIQMGTYFQVQDDFLDCYGAPEFIGKIGTDIEDTKCSWLVVQALQRANDEQKKLIEDNYGKHDSAKVAVIKKVYIDLNLEKAFSEYEQESYEKLTSAINKQKTTEIQAVLNKFLGKIYKRQK